MKPIRSGGRTIYKLRIILPDGRRRNCSCGTSSLATARAVTRFIETMRAERRWDVLDAIVSGKVTLAYAYDKRADLDGLLSALADLNIEPQVTKWHTEKAKARKGAKSADRYMKQVRRLIPAGQPFPVSSFKRRTIDEHLRKLDVDDPTRNRHRAAFMSFAKYLVRADILNTNVVRDIEGWSEGPGRIVYYERDVAQRVIAALPQPFAALEALMVGAGLEWESIETLRAEHVDLKKRTVLANADKTGWRRRLSRIVELWTIPFIKPALASTLPATRPFAGISNQKALRQHRLALKAAGVTDDSRLHDWRHTHAVLMLREGYRPTVVAHQLGHRDTNLVWKRYGRFVVDDRDYVLDKAGLEQKPTPVIPLTPPNAKEHVT